MPATRFRPCRLDDVESAEDYQPGGFHPVAIGDTLAEGRYRVVHKLGFGGSSTLWLARNQLGKLVTLKVLRADTSAKPADDIPDLAVPRKISQYLQKQGSVARSNIQALEDHFTETGPNGTHLCLVSQLAGPSILSMLDCPGRVSGSRRPRKDLAKKFAKQLASAVELMHAAGFLHGDITTSNVLLLLSEDVQKWNDGQVYLNFGQPRTEKVVTLDGSSPGPHIPNELVSPIDNHLMTNSSFLQEDILLIDFGQSFLWSHPPKDYEPATVIHYQNPEDRFDGTISASADVWALACTIFEIRAGFPLFEAFLGGEDEVLKEIVATLGKLPQPWWDKFDDRHLWFDEDGRPKALGLQKVMIPAEKTSIKQKLASIGSQDEPPTTGSDGPMMERPGTRLEEVEIQLLGDLLEKMLRYRPEERINMKDVLSHPWFA